MSTFLVIAVILLVFVIIFQIAKASEYVSVLKGEEVSRKNNNKINGFFMIGFLVVGLIGVWYCNHILYDKTLLPYESASEQGERVDSMLWLTLTVTGIVFILTQIILFWFSFKYQEKEGRKTYYFPHNNKLELIWTVIPAIALTVLVVIGLRNWLYFTSDAPANSQVVEVTGKQFGWIFRYAGKDGEFGKKYFRNINDANNPLGLIWANNDSLKLQDDPRAHDDIVGEGTMYCVVNKPVKLVINSRDVIHDVGLSEFRLKMDAVPGTPTTLWFTPKFTTAEMKEIKKNPNYQYEISCDQMCGNGHYSMKGTIVVLTQAEYDEWAAKQSPAYFSAFPDKAPKAAVVADSTAKKPVVDTTKKVAMAKP